MSADIHLTIGQVRRIYCVKGLKKVFDSGVFPIDFATFVKHGATTSQLRGCGHDAMIDRAVEAVKETPSS